MNQNKSTTSNLEKGQTKQYSQLQNLTLKQLKNIAGGPGDEMCPYCCHNQ